MGKIVKKYLLDYVPALIGAIYIYSCIYNNTCYSRALNIITLLDALSWVELYFLGISFGLPQYSLTSMSFIPGMLIFADWWVWYFKTDFNKYKYGTFSLLFVIICGFELFFAKHNHILILSFFLIMLVLALILRYVYLKLKAKYANRVLLLENCLVIFYFLIIVSIAKLYFDNGILIWMVKGTSSASNIQAYFNFLAYLIFFLLLQLVFYKIRDKYRIVLTVLEFIYLSVSLFQGFMIFAFAF